jgi:hypothetical protein
VLFESNSILTRADPQAFYKCSSLETICIPSGVDVLGRLCFANCTRLSSVQFERNSRLTRIEQGAFSSCSSLEHLCIPSRVEVLCERSFELCISLREVTFGLTPVLPPFREIEGVVVPLGSQLRRIESFAFASCTELDAIFIPPLVDTIEPFALSGAPIRDIIVADGNRHFTVRDRFLLTRDGTSLIHYFGKKSEVEISREVTVLSTGTFSGCSNLWNVTFERGSALQRIESRAFSGCFSLRSIFIPSFVDTIDVSAFSASGIDQLIVAYDNPHFTVRHDFLLNRDETQLIRYFGIGSQVSIFQRVRVLCRKSFSGCSDLRDVYFEPASDLRRIESQAFSGCFSLHSIFIPSLVKTISKTAFKACEIANIIVADENIHFKVRDNCLLSGDGRTLIRAFGKEAELPIAGPNALSRVTLVTSDSTRDSAARDIQSCALAGSCPVRRHFADLPFGAVAVLAFLLPATILTLRFAVSFS